MTKKILIGTKNPGKFEEISTILNSWGYEAVTLSSLKKNHEVEEDLPTFTGNAIKKATEFCQLSGLPTIADDGGLCIDALQGMPGVKSRRWDGSNYMDDQKSLDYTLEQMKNVPEGQRQASLITVVALVFPNGLTCYAKKEIAGEITTKQMSPIIAGYPFRSIFWVTKLNKLYAELTPQEHKAENCRQKALQQLQTILT